MSEDMVNSPKHYSPGEHEVYKCLASWGLEDEAFAWNAAKYLARYKKKGDPVENLEKAIWYINKLIDKIKAKQALEKNLEARARANTPDPRAPLCTNGYCDTCSDQYVKGYELHHKDCRKH